MGTTESDRRDTEPYRDAAALYFDAGWTAPLPLPYKAKASVPVGFTGRHPDPSRADIQAWIDGDEGAGNIALRLPEHVVGIDVDAYGDKVGATTLAEHNIGWGTLPRTWRVTSRDDGVSGIYLYRVPPHLAWPGQLGPDVEIIQHRHRYCLVWPSVHPTGGLYRWHNAEGLPSTTPPDPDLLPMLPAAWVDGLTGRKTATDTPRNELGAGAAAAWVHEHSRAGDPCRRVQHALHTALADLTASGSSHESTRAATLRLVGLAADGHTGVPAALSALRVAFLDDVTSPGRPRQRTVDEAQGEWASLVVGAVNLASADPRHTVVGEDPCANPFAGIIAPSPTTVTLPSLPSPALPSQDWPIHTPPSLPRHEDGTTPRPDVAEVEHSSWAPVDLLSAWDGEDDDREAPDILRRADGAALLYRGQVNGLIGESESGKTWIALEAVRQVLADGGSVQLYDFEDTKGGATTRLKLLDVPREAIAEGRLRYINPDEPVMAGAATMAWTDLAANLAEHPDLIVVDGYNAAMVSQGLNMDSNTDVTVFVGLLRKMAASGAAVVAIDHVPKDPDRRLKGGIGAQAKRSGMTGATIKVEVDGDAYPAPGRTGILRMSVDKDRRGGVREHAVGDHVGMATIESTPGAVSISIGAPDPNAVPVRAAKGAVKGKIRDDLMERICDFLLTWRGPGKPSQRKVKAGVKGSDHDIVASLDELVRLGKVRFDFGQYGPEYELVSAYHRGDPADLLVPEQMEIEP